MVYCLVLRYHRPTDSVYTQGQPMGLVAAMGRLKAAFTSALIHHHFDPSPPPVVETESSESATAGILSVRTEDGQVHPVAFFSRTLTGLSSTTTFTIRSCLPSSNWRHYLESPQHMVDVNPGHKNLGYFSSTKMLTRHQGRDSSPLLTWLFALDPGNSESTRFSNSASGFLPQKRR
jgi:hypothetical protein